MHILGHMLINLSLVGSQPGIRHPFPLFYMLEVRCKSINLLLPLSLLNSAFWDDVWTAILSRDKADYNSCWAEIEY